MTACESSGGTISGRLDETKYVKAVKAVPAQTHKETRREKKTKQSCSGTGTKRTCKTVDDGYRTVIVTVTDKPGKPAKSALYCVELDHADNDTTQNDQWFEVDAQTYHKWSGKAEGTKVKKMAYTRTLTSCTR
jgi:hypothetical protein